MSQQSKQVIDARPDPANLVTQEKLDRFFAPRTRGAGNRKAASEEKETPPAAPNSSAEGLSASEPPPAPVVDHQLSANEDFVKFGFTESMPKRKYQVITCPAYRDLASRLEAEHPQCFKYHPTKWEKFPDGTDNIEVGGFYPKNLIRGEHVLFLASFHNNDSTLSQFYVLIVLLESFIQSLTIVLPFYPTGTMERVTKEGQVATASTLARMFNNLPSCGPPSCLIIYDLHTLQNRFYVQGHCIAQLETTIPLLKRALANREAEGKTPVDTIAFPDDGAAKRFGTMFEEYDNQITCGKHREGDRRIITVMDGDPAGKNIIIIDDLVQSGGTLYETSQVLIKQGALSVCAFVAHGVFPKESWRRFLKDGDKAGFDTFYITNSVPSTTSQIPEDDVFHVLDIMPKIVHDLV